MANRKRSPLPFQARSSPAEALTPAYSMEWSLQAEIKKGFAFATVQQVLI